MFTVENTLKALQLFSQKVEDNHVYLSELDTPIGDGDHGFNMNRGVKALSSALEGQDFNEVFEVLQKAAMELMSNVGGASGPLYGSAMLSMAKKAKETTDVLPIVQAGLEGIQKRGQAQVGDKTMVDVWQQVVDALEKDETIDANKITQWVESTKDLKANKGRASYLGERSVGHIDPGSQSSGYFFESLLEAGVI
ncbi:dihydroxyacetone kinase subunit DhaL [Dolosicoccus paucivorans]|uniref:dihydroxyacetone kinase subunit DhaL n=1 Tax=Dolosicoccus paucivorans TaxID=84521 RepID=UPI00088288C3|nr:dihydroxyacetone kinase subunit DhaL [Dolosicoccus paucivorans]SDI37369.1 dihydroxyacetone kinase DhaL subunit [Dolosicoccus paucivorans]